MRPLFQIALLFVAVVINTPIAEAQVCEGNLRLYTQAEVDAFDCVEVTGDIIIRFNSAISNLNGLSELTTVGRDFILIASGSIPHLDGLSALTSVGEDITINANFVLTSIEGLASLDHVGGNFSLESNPILSACTVVLDLVDRDVIGGEITIGRNGARGAGCYFLCEISDTCAHDCAGDVHMPTQVEVDYAPCTEIAGDLVIGTPIGQPRSNINDLSNLAPLVSVGGSILIQGTSNLVDLHGLEGLTSVGGDLRIYRNDGLIAVDGLSGLTSIPGQLKISGNWELEDLAGLSNLTEFGGFEFLVTNNPSLVSLSDLSGVTSVGWQVKIGNNDALQDIGMESLQQISGHLILVLNDSLTDIGFPNLTSVGGDVEIGYYDPYLHHHALVNLEGLSSLTSIGGDLLIANNAALEGGDGLANLTSVSGQLWIQRNPQLSNLDDLSSLSSIGSSLSIRNNAALMNVDGLSAITNVNSILIRDNPSLSECKEGLSELLVDMSIPAVIYRNAPGCNSFWEAIGGAVDTEDEATPLVTALAAPYPNPTAGVATLAFTLAEAGDVTLTVYDALGRRVATVAKGPHPVGRHEAAFGAGLSAGTYVVRFEAGSEAWTERVTLVR